MTADTVKKNREDVEMKPYELIQKIPELIETIDTLVNPLFEFGEDDVVSEDDFCGEFRYNRHSTDFVTLAFQLFEKLYESRQTLDALQSAIPVLKGELKKRDEQDRQKDAELMKLRPIIDQVKKKTEEMSKLSKELANISLGVSPESKSYCSVAGQKANQVRNQKKVAPPPASVNTLKTAVKAMFHDEDRKKNIILFGLGEDDDESLKDKVSEVLMEIDQKPRLGQVVRLGQPTGRCRPVRVSLESSDTVHSILKESTKLKSSTVYSKVFISPDRTPEERIKHTELVREMKNKIQSDSSKHWKISKGEVVSAEIKVSEVISDVKDCPSNLVTQPETPELKVDAANVEIEIPVEEKAVEESPVEEKAVSPAQRPRYRRKRSHGPGNPRRRS